MKPESLTRCGIKSVDFESTGGGRPELTASEIAGALRGCGDASYYLAVQVLLGEDHTHKIAGMLYDKDLKQHKGKSEKPVLTHMAILIVAEVTGSMSCLSCGGTGIARMDDLLVNDPRNLNTCKQCRNGKSYPTDSQKARFCKVKNWNQWEQIYNSAYNRCSGWLSTAYSKLGGE